MARLIFFFLIFLVLAPFGWPEGLWVAVGLLWLFTKWVTRGEEAHVSADTQAWRAAERARQVSRVLGLQEWR